MMLGFLHSSLNEISFHGRVNAKKPKVIQNYVYRDELDKKPSSKPSKVVKEEAKPLLQREEGEKKQEIESINIKAEEKSGTKVKILMTKEEARRLLSKCKEGGVLEFKDVALELVQIPMNRVSVVSPCTISDGKLESIPEELL